MNLVKIVKAARPQDAARRLSAELSLHGVACEVRHERDAHGVAWYVVADSGRAVAFVY